MQVDDKPANGILKGFNELKMCRSGPMLFNKYDQYIGGSLKKYGEFSLLEQLLFRELVRGGDLVVEVGANIGAHTVELSRLAGAQGEVHAFEPQRIVFQTLCANLALNQCANVHAEQAALGTEMGTVDVPSPDPNVPANFGGISLIGARGGEKVPMITLDSLELPACHFLKADVEGMEVEVLKGAARTIDAYRPVLYLENDRDERSRELLEIVLSIGYRAYWHLPFLFNPGNFAGDPENIFPGIISVNVLCVPQASKFEGGGLDPVSGAGDTWRGKHATVFGP